MDPKSGIDITEIFFPFYFAVHRSKGFGNYFFWDHRIIVLKIGLSKVVIDIEKFKGQIKL